MHDKSYSNRSTWPIILEIQNLPPNIRHKEGNYIIVGMTTGNLKPDLFKVVMEWVVTKLNGLWREGVWVYDVCAKESFLCKTMVYTSRHDGQALNKVYIQPALLFCIQAFVRTYGIKYANVT